MQPQLIRKLTLVNKPIADIIMSQSLAFVEVIKRREDIQYWNIDSLINSKSFRCMRTKFPLCYYNHLVLILAQVDRYFLDIIYTDSDFLMATWDASRLLPVENDVISGRLTYAIDEDSGSCEDTKNVMQSTAKFEENRRSGQINARFEEGECLVRPTLQTDEGSKTESGLKKATCAVILLGGVSCNVPTISYAEARLSSTAYKNWLTLQFILLPDKMAERFVVMEELILQYDRLVGLSDGEEGGNIRENVIETVQMVTGTAAENTATIGIETTASSLGHAAAGVVLAVFVDIAVTASMLARAKVRKDRGRITEQQYKREVRERLFQTGCQFVAGTTGTLVGQIVLPVPVVGAAIGGFVGSLVGLGVSMGVSKIHKVVERAKKRKEMMMIEN